MVDVRGQSGFDVCTVCGSTFLTNAGKHSGKDYCSPECEEEAERVDLSEVEPEFSSRELIEEHGPYFREIFESSPDYPYSVYQSILESDEFSAEEKSVLKDMKDAFRDQWLEEKEDGGEMP